MLLTVVAVNERQEMPSGDSLLLEVAFFSDCKDSAIRLPLVGLDWVEYLATNDKHGNIDRLVARVVVVVLRRC